ncbi:unnamed protein product [Oikopleura dioica]|uniref:FAD-binding domain-containing protein n=1 Tax=Oikopleura dioica TaxID=34765 RepID=E4WWV7_OIKDI|nr:unnamed protein product [Oikopleura dioica]
MFDTVCVGAGLIGGVQAALLRRSRHLPRPKVLLTDGARRPSFSSQLTKNIRQIAVNPGSRQLLQDTGAWEKLGNSPWAVNKITVWDSMGHGGLEFEAKHEENPIFHITEVPAISAAGVDAAEDAGVELMFESKLENIKIPNRFNQAIQDTDYVSFKINESEFETRLLLGCDGANSSVRKAAGLGQLSKNYDQRGFVCTVRAENVADNRTAFQRFLPSGDVIALLPCEEDQLSIVWSCAASKAKMLESLDADELISKINEYLVNDETPTLIKTLHNSLSFIPKSIGLKTEMRVDPPIITEVLSPTGSFPLGSALATNMVAPRTAILGDAAHRVHPFAGQGANMGWRDVELLTDELERAHLSGIDYTSQLSLSKYEKAALLEHAAFMSGLEGLKQLYKTNATPFVLARNVGTMLVNNNSALKDIFISRAS